MLAALEIPDDQQRTADHGALLGEVDADAPTVTREAAAAQVFDCLEGRRPSAFGEDAEWWTECLMDALADSQTVLLVGLRYRVESPSILRGLTSALHNVIELNANRLLAELEEDYL